MALLWQDRHPGIECVVRPIGSACLRLLVLPETVDNEAGLGEVLGTRSSMKFDLDTYKLLLKTLGKQTEVITFGVE